MDWIEVVGMLLVPSLPAACLGDVGTNPFVVFMDGSLEAGIFDTVCLIVSEGVREACDCGEGVACAIILCSSLNLGDDLDDTACHGDFGVAGLEVSADMFGLDSSPLSRCCCCLFRSFCDMRSVEGPATPDSMFSSDFRPMDKLDVRIGLAFAWFIISFMPILKDCKGLSPHGLVETFDDPTEVGNDCG